MVGLERQFQRARDDIMTTADNPGSASGSFATQQWLTMSPAELDQLSEELLSVMRRWQSRELPDDGVERETCFVFARGFPAQP